MGARPRIRREDCRSLLGVSASVTPDAIRDRFRFLCQAYHPDKFTTPEYRRLAEEEFKLINEANRILTVHETAESNPVLGMEKEPDLRDHYAVLRIHPRATTDQIQKRHQFLQHAYDPARFASDQHKKNAEEELRRIDEAFRILSNPEQRARFDNSRRKPAFRPLLRSQYVPFEPGSPKRWFHFGSWDRQSVGIVAKLAIALSLAVGGAVWEPRTLFITGPLLLFYFFYLLSYYNRY